MLRNSIQINEIKVSNHLIKYIEIQSKIVGKLVIETISAKDAVQLFDFYFHGLSEAARVFFCPYPIFNPRPNNSEELANTIRSWRQEDDWTVLKLSKDSQIIGICLLKRYKTKRPTSGLAIHEKFQKMGLGIFLQTIINEQVRLLKIKKLIITLAPDNIASFKVHTKAGFKKTGKLVPHFVYIDGVKKIDRNDIEMIKEFY